MRAALLAALLLAGCAAPSLRYVAPPQPDAAATQPGWSFSRQAVVAAHPLAADAGAQVLRAGGSVVDAAIATQAVLGLVEPESSGIGGGAFLVHWDGAAVQAWDGRETAPAAADERLFLDHDGKPLPFNLAVAGGRSVGTPGVLRMLEAAHREHGKLTWASLFEPAITLAEQGFRVGARLSALLEADPHLRTDPVARALFYTPDGRALAPGSLLRNPDYAAVLRRIARDGADALHRGPVAERIVQAVRSHPRNPGRLDAADLAAYKPLRREPLCFDWGSARLCGIGPPSSGTIAIGQILALAALALPANASAITGGLPSADFLHVYTEASRLAFADRAQYVADPAFVRAPAGRWESLLDPAYLVQRGRLIGARSMGRAAAGAPAGDAGASRSSERSLEVPATSHLSIVDARGHALAMTTTIESRFGARLMVNSGQGLAGGFLLNNQLTDFSFAAEEDGRPVANRVEPGKRPRSSMSPMVVFDVPTKRALLVTGSPGGAPIIHYTAKTILATLAWGFDAQQAVNLPNFGSLNGPTLLEAGRFPQPTLDALRSRGHEVQEQELTSGAHTLVRTTDGWSAGADPRRNGWAAGD